MPLSASELSLTEVRDKVPPLRRLDPGLMPLPDTACGLEWSSLVNAAKAYEGELVLLVDLMLNKSQIPENVTDLLYVEFAELTLNLFSQLLKSMVDVRHVA